MKSDHSMKHPPDLKDGNNQPSKKRKRQERADAPGPSCVSMKSDWEERQHQEKSKVTSDQFVQQHQTELINIQSQREVVD
ncbi:unnamed protein product, partial [Lota lota]